jgi:hypothetical protein
VALRGAGVSPAVPQISITPQKCGETPALQTRLFVAHLRGVSRTVLLFAQTAGDDDAVMKA